MEEPRRDRSESLASHDGRWTAVVELRPVSKISPLVRAPAIRLGSGGHSAREPIARTHRLEAEPCRCRDRPRAVFAAATIAKLAREIVAPAEGGAVCRDAAGVHEAGAHAGEA